MSDPEGNTEMLVKPGEMESNRESVTSVCGGDTMKPTQCQSNNSKNNNMGSFVFVPLNKQESQDDSLADNENEDDDDNHNSAMFLWVFRANSIGLGLLIGFFIQFSSLGANFVLSNLFGNEQQSQSQHQQSRMIHLELTRQSIVVFSLGWSFLTSTMGVLILLCMRSIIVKAWSTLERSNSSSSSSTAAHAQRLLQEQLVVQMECYFAVGALVGVCLAWVITDILLGYSDHIFHSLLTLGSAMIWCKVISHCLSDNHNNNNNENTYGMDNQQSDDDDDCDNELYKTLQRDFSYNDDESLSTLSSNDLTKPLIESCESDEENYSSREDTEEEMKGHFCHFKAVSCAIGVVVGVFVQFSALGANFLLKTLYGTGYGNALGVSRQFIVSFSLGWSFFTSVMSVVTLVFLRSIVVMAYSATTSNRTFSTTRGDQGFLTLRKLISTIECFFAIGALLGVNVAWIVTDLVVGLDAHIWHSLMTLFMALVWCKIILVCFCAQNAPPMPVVVQDAKAQTVFV